VWELIRDGARVSNVCAAITREYDVPSGRCEADVLALLHQLQEKGLIEVGRGD
jgi:hypothetical protein